MGNARKGGPRQTFSHVVLTRKGAGPKAPPGDVVGIRALAHMLSVNEITVRRWWQRGRIPPPTRFMQSLYWASDLATAIARSGPGPCGTYPTSKKAMRLDAGTAAGPPERPRPPRKGAKK